MRTDKQIVEQTNQMAIRFMCEMGFLPEDKDIKMWKVQLQLVLLCWRLACIAQEILTNTEVENAMDGLEAEELDRLGKPSGEKIISINCDKLSAKDRNVIEEALRKSKIKIEIFEGKDGKKMAKKPELRTLITDTQLLEKCTAEFIELCKTQGSSWEGDTQMYFGKLKDRFAEMISQKMIVSNFTDEQMLSIKKKVNKWRNGHSFIPVTIITEKSNEKKTNKQKGEKK